MSELLGPGTLPGNDLSYYTSFQYFGLFGKILDTYNFNIDAQVLADIGIDPVNARVAIINQDRVGTLRSYSDDIAVDLGGSASFGENTNDNFLIGGSGDDTFRGGSGDDHLEGNNGADALSGQGGEDRLFGGRGSDFLFGGDDDDVLWGDANTAVRAAFGDDGLAISSFTYVSLDKARRIFDQVQKDGDLRIYKPVGDPPDDVDAILWNETLYDTVRDYVLRERPYDGTATGFGGEDFLDGGNGNDVLLGGNAGDILVGGAGNDFLDPGARGLDKNRDVLFGGMGYDTFYVSAQDSTASNEAIDFFSSYGDSLPANIAKGAVSAAVKDVLKGAVSGALTGLSTSVVTSVVGGPIGALVGSIVNVGLDEILSAVKKAGPLGADNLEIKEDRIYVQDFNPLEDIIVLPMGFNSVRDVEISYGLIDPVAVDPANLTGQALIDQTANKGPDEYAMILKEIESGEIFGYVFFDDGFLDSLGIANKADPFVEKIFKQVVATALDLPSEGTIDTTPDIDPENPLVDRNLADVGDAPIKIIGSAAPVFVAAEDTNSDTPLIGTRFDDYLTVNTRYVPPGTENEPERTTGVTDPFAATGGTVFSGDGDDTVTGSDKNDVAFTGAGDDVAYSFGSVFVQGATVPKDEFDLGAGNDILVGSALRDALKLRAGDGLDILDLGFLRPVFDELPDGSPDIANPEGVELRMIDAGSASTPTFFGIDLTPGAALPTLSGPVVTGYDGGALSDDFFDVAGNPRSATGQYDIADVETFYLTDFADSFAVETSGPAPVVFGGIGSDTFTPGPVTTIGAPTLIIGDFQPLVDRIDLGAATPTSPEDFTFTATNFTYQGLAGGSASDDPVSELITAPGWIVEVSGAAFGILGATQPDAGLLFLSATDATTNAREVPITSGAFAGGTDFIVSTEGLDTLADQILLDFDPALDRLVLPRAEAFTFFDAATDTRVYSFAGGQTVRVPVPSDAEPVTVRYGLSAERELPDLGVTDGGTFEEFAKPIEIRLTLPGEFAIGPGNEYSADIDWVLDDPDVNLFPTASQIRVTSPLGDFPFAFTPTVPGGIGLITIDPTDLGDLIGSGQSLDLRIEVDLVEAGLTGTDALTLTLNGADTAPSDDVVTATRPDGGVNFYISRAVLDNGRQDQIVLLDFDAGRGDKVYSILGSSDTIQYGTVGADGVPRFTLGDENDEVIIPDAPLFNLPSGVAAGPIFQVSIDLAPDPDFLFPDFTLDSSFEIANRAPVFTDLSPAAISEDAGPQVYDLTQQVADPEVGDPLMITVTGVGFVTPESTVLNFAPTDVTLDGTNLTIDPDGFAPLIDQGESGFVVAYITASDGLLSDTGVVVQEINGLGNALGGLIAPVPSGTGGTDFQLGLNIVANGTADTLTIDGYNPATDRILLDGVPVLGLVPSFGAAGNSLGAIDIGFGLEGDQLTVIPTTPGPLTIDNTAFSNQAPTGFDVLIGDLDGLVTEYAFDLSALGVLTDPDPEDTVIISGATAPMGGIIGPITFDDTTLSFSLNDSFVVAAGSSVSFQISVDISDGTDSAIGLLSGAVITPPNVTTGTGGNDTDTGTANNDIVLLFGGNDSFTALGGDDSIQAGAGNDTIDGGIGDDDIDGGPGRDRIDGGLGDDVLKGGDANDTIFGREGDDSVWGGNGRDLVYLNQGNDIFFDNSQGGENGQDTVYAGFGNDTIRGENGDDVFFGNEGYDLILGRLGDDKIYGGVGYDTLDSGDGNDSVWGGDGRDRVLLGDGDDLFFDNAQGGANGRDTVFGGAGRDTINGGNGDDEFHGGGGADLIWARLGNDKVFGGDWEDTVYAGDGNDSVWGGNGRDQAFLGAGNDVFTDNAQAGVNGHDYVSGAGGDDTIRLQGGNDTAEGGDGADTFEFVGTGFGNDVIRDFALGLDTLVVDASLRPLDQAALDAIADTSSGSLVLTFNTQSVLTLEGVTSTAGLLDDFL